jgi:hypothetical protein
LRRIEVNLPSEEELEELYELSRLECEKHERELKKERNK